MIVFENVSYTYPGASRPALQDVSLTLAAGEWLAVVGANGSGKSTLARLFDGLLVPTMGRVVVEGVDTADEARAFDVRSSVGLVLQNPDNQIVGTFVEEDVAFGPENLGVARKELRERVDAAIAAVGLTGLERREPHLLSEGQKQRLAIAGALAMQPAWLVLDEATAMLDPEGRQQVLEIVERLHAAGTGIVQITHDFTEVTRAERVLALDAGSVAYVGPPEGLLASPELMDAIGVATPSLHALARALGPDVAGRLTATAGGAELLEALWRS